MIEVLCAVDRRKSRRQLTGGVAMLDWWSEAGGPVHLPAEVDNISDEGAQVRTSRRVPAQEIIRLSGKDLECVSIVRYCTIEADDYLVGLQFIEEPHARLGRR